MNEALKKKGKYQQRYMQRHRMLCVCLDKEKDADIVKWLDKQPVISDSAKKALRAYMYGAE